LGNAARAKFGGCSKQTLATEEGGETVKKCPLGAFWGKILRTGDRVGVDGRSSLTGTEESKRDEVNGE